jgi:secretion/DNA translocation related TadE-like protein
VWVLAAGLLTVLVALAASTVGSAIVARHGAQGAAGLAALAGAARAVEGESVACARAGQVAGANHAHLVACRLEGWDLVVTTRVVPGGPAAVAGTASASARAGPISPPA